ncbi:MAG: polysaccharide lyase family 8 super-sandwich domain-containing protein [Verrucomicrobiota bacterium]
MKIHLQLVLTSILVCVALAGDAMADTENTLKDIKIVRGRFVDELFENKPSASRVRELIETIREDGSWPDINYKDVSSTGWDHKRHLANMLTLSVAFKSPGSEFHNQPAVRATILSAFDYWLKHDFKGQNWYHNIISTPSMITDILLLMNDELNAAQRKKAYRIAGRANMQSRWARPGADRSRIAGILGRFALVKKDAETLTKAVNVMAKAVHVTTQRGLQGDMSYQHRTDGVTSTLTYGRAYLWSFADYADKLADTAFEFPEHRLKLMVDFCLDGIAKSMAHGRYDDPQQENRGIARKHAGGPADVEALKALVAATSYRRDEMETLIAVRKGEKEPNYRFNKYFWRSTYHTHQRPAYFTSVRLYSKRNRSMERPYNDEGLRNHYLADGANFIIRTGAEYFNGEEGHSIFPAYDWRKIPGATVVQKEGMPNSDAIQRRGRTEFVGGVSDGIYGATVFDFDSPIDDLKAKKAWFFFDNEYVCLGAGIKSDEQHPVATTMNQCLLNGNVGVLKGGRMRGVRRGLHTFSNLSAVWHDQVAYIFASPTEVRLKNDKAKGSWWRITRQSWARGAKKVELDRFMLWIDHGAAPDNAQYAYVVAPGLAVDRVADYVSNAPIRILHNTSALQAVAHKKLGITYGVFYEKGEMKALNGPKIKVGQPGLVMCRVRNGRVQRLAVTDPTGKVKTFQFALDTRLDGKGERWAARWNPDRKQTDIKIDLPRKNKDPSRTVILDFDQ